MRKPKIGIIANKLYMETGLTPSLYRAYVNNDYVESLEKAGCIPVMIPVINDLDDVKEQLTGLDGILISGGYDLDPTLYGEEPTHSGFTMLEIDRFYLEVVKQADLMNLPILGICKGIQAINVAFGGTLYQDLGAQKKDVIKHSQQAARYCPTHSITVKQDTFMAKVFKEHGKVNSYHHQSVKDVAEGFVVTAEAPDGVVEAIERKEGSFICGVQFHPEMMAKFDDPTMLTLFKLFAEQCK